MKSKVKNLSKLIDTQLPNFILSEYPKFSAFLKKYYEQLELPGQPLDIVNNLTKYRDVDTYQQELLKERTRLTSSVASADSVIFVEDTSSFPDENGYILIDEEVIFYRAKTNTSFVDCYRNVNATTKLGDLYNELQTSNVNYEDVGNGLNHVGISEVINVSYLFLYALTKNFESEYLGPFPENLLRENVNRAALIKNIKHFYASKGTKQSIQFVFNALISDPGEELPEVYYPKDYTLKTSNGDWATKYSLKALLLDNVDIKKIIGSEITETKNGNRIAYGVIDNIVDLNNGFIEIVLDEQTAYGKFTIASKTKLKKDLSSSSGAGKKIYVNSTSGFEANKILIENEIISVDVNNVNQFTINYRESPVAHDADSIVHEYKVTTIKEFENPNNEVNFIIFGVISKLNVLESSPYSKIGDVIQRTSNDSTDVVVFNKIIGNYRWIVNQTLSAPDFVSPYIDQYMSSVVADVSAIYEDKNYFYIASSGYPSYPIGKINWNIGNFADQKVLKLIPKNIKNTTEIYETPNSDVGIFVNGVLAHGYKDFDQINFGKLIEITVTDKGKNYLNPPYVIVENDLNEDPATAYSVLSGEVVDSVVVVESGSNFKSNPNITITSGRNAQVSAVVTLGRITSLKIDNPGEYYSSPPEIRIRDRNGSGRFARYNSLIEDGKLVGFEKLDEGKFYSQDNVIIDVIPVGSGAKAVAKIKTWTKDKVFKNSSIKDSSNGIYFENNNTYGYCHVANPVSLRQSLNDTGSQHSPILGYAYDGNPIYGPYGYSDAVDSSSPITLMSSSYSLLRDRVNGPKKSDYPMGSFIEDYEYRHRSGNLDENNGRFCVTPDYPDGVYAYFITIDNAQQPVFPYIIGKNYYSLPSQINYTESLSQKDLPKTVRRLSAGNNDQNGLAESLVVSDVYSGGVTGVNVYNSPEIFSVGNIIYGEDGIQAKVSEIYGKPVVAIESNETKAIKLSTKTPCYFFDGDTISQPDTGASGELVGNIFDGKNLVIRNITPSINFDANYPIESTISVSSVFVDKASTFTKDSIVRLINNKKVIIKSVSSNKLQVSSNPFVDGEPIVFSNSFSGLVANQIYYVVDRKIKSFKVASFVGGTEITLTDTTTPSAIAEGESARGFVLESIQDKNNLKIKIIQGNFDVNNSYYLKSNTTTDTVFAKIVSNISLSSDIEIDTIDDSIGLVQTSEDHGLSEGDYVNIDIIPDDSSTTTTYYLRKRLYQKVKLSSPSFTSFLDDTGIGRFRTLNNGSYPDAGEIVGDYANGLSDTFTNVELLFLDQTKVRKDIGKPGDVNNAKATINVINGVVTSLSITTKGSGYLQGDLLTVSNESLDRLPASINSNYLILEVDHVGFSSTETKLRLGNASEISEGDLLVIGNEVVEVSDILSSKEVSVLRARKNTQASDHFNDTIVTLFESKYNLSTGYNPQGQVLSFIVENYDSVNNELTISYDVNANLNNSIKIFSGSSFLDESSPKKSVRIIEVLENLNYNFEFSTDNSTWSRNPILKLLNNYKYIFNLSNTSLKNTFFEISPAKNYNIVTTESESSSILPGNVGSYYSVKFGYGDNISSNDFSIKKSILYTKYFYFDKSNTIDSNQSYFEIIPDTLQGRKKVTYVTSNRFAYDLEEIPNYDGSGAMSYFTSSSTAEGSIKSAFITLNKNDLTELPIVIGSSPSSSNESIIFPEIVDGKIVSADIILSGRNYVNPKIYIEDISGSGAEFKLITNNEGQIIAVNILNSGSNYSNNVTLKVIETSSEIYFYSDTIGKTKVAKVSLNGYYFNSDFTLRSNYTNGVILSLKNIGNEIFSPGQFIEQYKDNILVASGYVAPGIYKKGSNIIKLLNVYGKFEENLIIYKSEIPTNIIVTKIFSSIFNAEYDSAVKSKGTYRSTRSHLNDRDQKISDSYYYQDYSYVIKSKKPINVWRKVITDTVHPAGFKVFGNLLVESSQKIVDAEVPTSIVHNSFVQLWDEDNSRVSVESVRKRVTISVAAFTDTNVQRGKGLIASPYADVSDTSTYELELYPDFNGYFDESGNLAGNTQFTMRIKGSTIPFEVINKNNLIITLDGIIQNSGSSFVVNGNQITFSQPPLGYRNRNGDSITALEYIPGVDTPRQKFVGRYISLKNQTDNNSLFKKLKDISNQFDGVKKEFNLYYEDDTPTSLQNKENLFISIDGVLQRSSEIPVPSIEKSYYIIKTTVPNKIVFLEAPLEETNFSGYSIGNYYRLKLGEDITSGNKRIFSLKTVLDDRTFFVDNERNLLVFIDGVLQQRNKSYTLSNSSFITFKTDLTEGQVVYILMCYGRDEDRPLTIFDFSDLQYSRRYTLTVDTNLAPFYISKFGMIGRYLYSVDDQTGEKYFNTRAKIVSQTRINNTTYEFGLLSIGNAKVYTNQPIEIPGIGSFSQFNIVSVSSFDKDTDNLFDVLRKTNSQTYKYIESGDLIKIDGETEYRKILDTPLTVKAYSEANSYFGKFNSSNNNSLTSSLSASVEAIIENGQVVDIRWSGDAMPNYLDGNDRFSDEVELIFVSQPQLDDGGSIISGPVGSGASAKLYITENQISGYRITSNGEGYIVPPKVFVGLGYDILKAPSNQAKREIFIKPPGLGIFVAADAIPTEVFFRYKGQEPGFWFLEPRLIISDYYVSNFITLFTEYLSEYGELKTDTKISTNWYPKALIDSVKDIIFVPLAKSYETSVKTIPTVSVSGDRSSVSVNTVSYVPNVTLELNSDSFTSVFIQLDFTDTDRVLYVSSTDKFTDTGYLLLNGEILYYSSKFSDRFFIEERSAFRTPLTNHPAGSLVRQYLPDASDIHINRKSQIEAIVATPLISINSPVDIILQPRELLVISKQQATFGDGSVTIVEISREPATDYGTLTPSVDSLVITNIDYAVNVELQDIILQPLFKQLTIVGAVVEEQIDLDNKIIPVIYNTSFAEYAALNRDIQINSIVTNVASPVTVESILQQSVLVSIGGRLEDVAVDVEPVFGGVATAYSVFADKVDTDIIPSVVFANITAIQEITVTPRIEQSTVTVESILQQSVLVSIGGRIEDVAIDVEPVFGGIATGYSIFADAVDTDIVLSTVFANIAAIQEITVTPRIESALATVESIITVSTDSISEGEVIFIETIAPISSTIAIELSVDVSHTALIGIEPTINYNINEIRNITSIEYQIELPIDSVISISSNEVIPNDVNDIQIYRTIETGLGSDGAGIDVLGEYPYQSELANVSPANIIAEVYLAYQSIIPTDISTIQEITVIPPVDDVAVTLTTIEAIIVTSEIDLPLIDNSTIAYQSEVYVGVTASSIVIDSVVTTNESPTSVIFVNTVGISEVVSFYESLRTSQSSVPSDPVISPVEITSVSTTIIDKIVETSITPATVLVTSDDAVIVTNIIEYSIVVSTAAVSIQERYLGVIPVGIVSLQKPDDTIITTTIDKNEETNLIDIEVINEITTIRSTGIVDYYQEVLYYNSDILTRSGDVVLTQSYTIDTNFEGSITLENITRDMQEFPYNTYAVGSVGISIGNIESNAFFNNTNMTTTNDVARIEIGQFSNTYPSITIEDFDIRSNSQISTAGDRINTGVSTFNTIDPIE